MVIPTCDRLRSILAQARPVKSTSRAKGVKIGRRQTGVWISQTMLMLLAAPEPPPTITMKQIYDACEALHVLDGTRSLGDAGHGNPDGKSPGLGLARDERSRHALGSREDAAICVRCLLGNAWTIERIAALVGREDEAGLAEWLESLPTREELRQRLAAGKGKAATPPAADSAAAATATDPKPAPKPSTDGNGNGNGNGGSKAVAMAAEKPEEDDGIRHDFIPHEPLPGVVRPATAAAPPHRRPQPPSDDPADKRANRRERDRRAAEMAAERERQRAEEQAPQPTPRAIDDDLD